MIMKEIKAVVFDMFNTLANNSIEFWLKKFKNIVDSYGFDIDYQEFWETWRIGDKMFSEQRINPTNGFISYLDGWTNSFEYALNKTNNFANPTLLAKECIYDLGTRPLFDDTSRVLNELSMYYKIAIASNADNDFLHPVIDRINANLETVVSSEDVESYKPMPDIFNETLNRLDMDPSEVLYVGDRQYEDVEGPMSIGMKAVWINRNKEPLNENLISPYAEISDLTDLLDVLNN